LSHIDYITLSLKHQWQQTGGALTLEDHIEKGLVPSSSVLAVTIVDRDGFPVTSTLPHNRRISIADRDYFLAHKADRTKDMVITQPVVGIRSKRPVMLLSRRLDARDGNQGAGHQARRADSFAIPILHNALQIRCRQGAILKGRK
jgi:hypothetical protein